MIPLLVSYSNTRTTGYHTCTHSPLHSLQDRKEVQGGLEGGRLACDSQWTGGSRSRQSLGHEHLCGACSSLHDQSKPWDKNGRKLRQFTAGRRHRRYRLAKAMESDLLDYGSRVSSLPVGGGRTEKASINAAGNYLDGGLGCVPSDWERKRRGLIFCKLETRVGVSSGQ